MVCRVEGKFESAISFAIRTFTVKTLIVYFAYDRAVSYTHLTLPTTSRV